jgi:hypothetical protein
VMEGRLTLDMRTQPRQRGFAPKVRTGCVSCKQARVKCSEGKPSCKRCTKHNIECSYKVLKAWIFVRSNERVCESDSRSHSNRFSPESQHKEMATPPCDYFELSPPCLNQGNTPTRSVYASPGVHSSTDGSPSLDLTPFQLLTIDPSFYPDPKHATALHYFLEGPSHRIAFNKSSDFFHITLPQAVWIHPAIAEAMTALATIAATLSGNSTAAWTRHPPLFHQSKAISMLITSNPGTHVTLHVCLMLWLYEQFDNQHTRALFHRASAANLLVDWRSHRRGADHMIDAYISEYIEPVFLIGLKMTAPVKLCREVLGALRSSTDVPGHRDRTCSYDQALNTLGACIDSFLTQGQGNIFPQTSGFSLRLAVTGLGMWNYQFEHYARQNWADDGPLLLSYGTTVAIIVKRSSLVARQRDQDWQRAIDFLLEETSKMDLEARSAHSSLFRGVASFSYDELRRRDCTVQNVT